MKLLSNIYLGKRYFTLQHILDPVLSFGNLIYVSGIYLKDVGLACLTVEWSKVLPLTAYSFSPWPMFKSKAGHVRKVPVTYG